MLKIPRILKETVVIWGTILLVGFSILFLCSKGIFISTASDVEYGGSLAESIEEQIPASLKSYQFSVYYRINSESVILSIYDSGDPELQEAVISSATRSYSPYKNKGVQLVFYAGTHGDDTAIRTYKLH